MLPFFTYLFRPFFLYYLFLFVIFAMLAERIVSVWESAQEDKPSHGNIYFADISRRDVSFLEKTTKNNRMKKKRKLISITIICKCSNVITERKDLLFSLEHKNFLRSKLIRDKALKQELHLKFFVDFCRTCFVNPFLIDFP